MSKKLLKETIKGLDQAQLAELIVEIYSASKEAKEYLDFYCNPDEEKKAEGVREKIDKEFFPANRRHGKCRFAPIKREISKLQKWGVSPRIILDTYLYLIESANKAIRYGRRSEASYLSMAKNMKTALEYADKHALYPEFKRRIDALAEASRRWGYDAAQIVGPAYESMAGPD